MVVDGKDPIERKRLIYVGERRFQRWGKVKVPKHEPDLGGRSSPPT